MLLSPCHEFSDNGMDNLYYFLSAVPSSEFHSLLSTPLLSLLSSREQTSVTYDACNYFVARAQSPDTGLSALASAITIRPLLGYEATFPFKEVTCDCHAINLLDCPGINVSEIC